jgi:polyisoprenoid-binding protein YceI
MERRSHLRRPRTWLIAVPLVVLLVVVAGPFIYINVIRDDPPERLTLPDEPAGQEAEQPFPGDGDGDRGAHEGTWTVTEGSEAGYRVGEVLFGQSTEGVGRTSEVTGEVEVDGTTIPVATFEVDLTSVESDEDRRDRQFHGRIMDTGAHPTATFELTEPIDIGTEPGDGEEITVAATGDFTIRGVTNRTTFDLLARRSGDTLEASGAIPVVFTDYGIPDATFGPAVVEDHGEIEFLVVLARG